MYVFRATCFGKVWGTSCTNTHVQMLGLHVPFHEFPRGINKGDVTLRGNSWKQSCQNISFAQVAFTLDFRFLLGHSYTVTNQKKVNFSNFVANPFACRTGVNGAHCNSWRIARCNTLCKCSDCTCRANARTARARAKHRAIQIQDLDALRSDKFVTWSVTRRQTKRKLISAFLLPTL